MVANWGLICNPSMKRTVTLAKDVMEFLQQQGTVWVEESIASELHCKGSTFKEINKNAEIVITIGGDGTLRGASAISEEIGRRKLKIAWNCLFVVILQDSKKSSEHGLFY